MQSIDTPFSRLPMTAAVLAVLFVTGGNLAAGELVARAIERDIRTYFEELSDDEYQSLGDGAKLYPLITKNWSEGPLTDSMFDEVDPGTYAEDGDIQNQQIALESGQLLEIRLQALAELAVAGNPASIELISNLVTTEGNNLVLAEALRSLRKLSVQQRSEMVTPLFKSEYGIVRREAYALYSLFPNRDTQVLWDAITSEPLPGIKADAYHMLSKKPDGTKAADWSVLLEQSEFRLSALQAITRLTPDADSVTTIAKTGTIGDKIAVAAALAHTKESSKASALLSVLLADENNVVCTAALDALLKHDALPLVDQQDAITSLAEREWPALAVAVARACVRINNPDAISTLLKLADTDSEMVEKAVVEALLGKAELGLNDLLESDKSVARRIAYRIIAGAQDYTSYRGIISQKVTLETDSKTLAAGLRASGKLNLRNLSGFINDCMRNDDPIIREGAVDAVGEMGDGDLAQLQAIAAKDAVQEVRCAALLAMAKINKPNFLQTYLQIARNTRGNSQSTPEDRAYAIWAATKLPSLNREFIMWLGTLVRSPSVMMEGVSDYDSTAVRISATLCLVSQARKPGVSDVLQQAKLSIEALLKEDMEYSENANMGSTAIPMPTGDQLRALGAEIDSCLTGNAFERVPVTPRAYRFSIRKLTDG